MAVILGIHIGHDSSCALVVDGVLVSAIQAERISRKKHHPILSLSNDLPVREVLEASGVRIDDVDMIVSSFQWVGPGGFGLHRQLIEPSFSLFDPWDERHRVLSHHLAHAYSTFELSGFQDAAVLVCDYAGSVTLNGLDYAQTFKNWHEGLISLHSAQAPKVECVSIYRADAEGEYRLLDRQYNRAHPGQASFVYSVAGLYENLALYVIGRPSAHGELMALAAFGGKFEGTEFDPGPLVLDCGSEDILFRNDWQHSMPEKPSFERKCCLAWRCQQATEIALEAMAKRAIRLSETNNLAVGGGVFLNILANSRLSNLGICSRFHVPSAPHDAGISVGCAFHGSRLKRIKTQALLTDRLGISYSRDARIAAIRAKAGFVQDRAIQVGEVIEALMAGKIIARWSGRSEFGPRALGGRSLLASPLKAEAKGRLNAIKGREAWRPVAPVVPADEIPEFFDGPIDSHWMTMSHQIREQHQSSLPALAHPDNSTRAQALLREQDPELFAWLKEFGAASGYPILVNTSFNRRGEPIVETANDAIDMYLDCDDIDWLILEDRLITRTDPLEWFSRHRVKTSESAILTRHFKDGETIHAVSINNRVWRISLFMHELLASLGLEPLRLEKVLSSLIDSSDRQQIREFLIIGVLSSLTDEVEIITTDRLTCDPVTGDHADVMYPLLLDERIYQFLPEKPPASLDALRERYEFLSPGRSPDGKEYWLNWILFKRSTDRPIGFFQATVRSSGCSVAYVLNPSFWNQGYATEAARAIITHLFNTYEMPFVTAEMNPQNKRSQDLVRRLGFSFVRHDADENDDIFKVSRADWLVRNSSGS